MGPHSHPYENGYRVFTPEDYVPLFKKLGVSHIVRLNKEIYDRQKFVKDGIQHTDLYFIDGSIPPEHIVDSFLDICD